ncbi:2-C-methyl-D-erythritol 4-phosphate cytidylyltransferase [Lachnospiraceae bacterium TWA4]|nr:2-C-methyl-D-erythritol 4-phosphate cytidylyltransferase [Lachnospiraceae bacterium TWA4]
MAAGRGSRMKSSIQKQYMELKGYPVLYYSLRAFEESIVDDIILVVGKDEIDYCKKDIVDKYGFTKVKKIIAGGSERYLSVYNAIESIKDQGYERILVHDGARPLITQEIIMRCIEGIDSYDACVAAMPVKDTIKVSDENEWAIHTPNRSSLYLIQTPQAFDANLIIEAYEKLNNRLQAGEQLAITDDAMVVETCMNREVKLIEGDYKNIKITTPEDIGVAEVFLKYLS